MSKLLKVSIVILLALPIGCTKHHPGAPANPTIQIKSSPEVRDVVSQSDIERVRSEAEKALELVPPLLGKKYTGTIQIRIVKGGICNARGGKISLPIRFVSTESAATIHEVTHLIAGHRDNRFFSEGLAVYFQERFGKDKSFPNFGVPLNALLREYKNEIIPLNRLHRNNDIFRQVGTEERRVAYMEAGSFINFLVESYGEEKLAALHNSWTLNYSKVYGKSLVDLEAEWMASVF